MLDELQKLSKDFLDIKDQSYKRYFIRNTPLTQRMSLLVGQRGVGKTTTVIQYLLAYANQDRFDPRIFYLQADHFLLGTTTLYDVVEQFCQMGGQFIGIDEIHKYANWSRELKSIYDTFPNLKIIASGSSALEIHRGTHDLSRRAILFTLFGLSFREYLELYYGLNLPQLKLQEILKDHEKITSEILNIITPSGKTILQHFSDYLKYGYYPYFREVKDAAIYYLLLEQNLHTTIESDLVAIYPSLTGNSVKKIKQLLSFISAAVPFTPNWQKLGSLTDVVDLRTLKTYFKYLEDAQVVQTVLKSTQKLNKFENPEKVYLNNTNQIYALSYDHPNRGTIREAFFLNILSTQHEVTLPLQGDFMVDDDLVFEIGGRKKGFEQIRQKKNAYVVCDEMEKGLGAKVPLWLFGFLY